MGLTPFARYRDIELDDAGTVLTFISPVKETINWATGETKDWGDTLCTVDLVSGTMRSMAAPVPDADPVVRLL